MQDIISDFQTTLVNCWLGNNVCNFNSQCDGAKIETENVQISAAKNEEKDTNESCLGKASAVMKTEF